MLFLGGRGRETPYLSTSELADRAALFAGGEGVVWKTWVARAEARGVRHVSARDLQQLLRGAGKGAAAWPTPWEVMRARQLVELHREHLLDFSEHSRDRAELRAAVDSMFERERR